YLSGAVLSSAYLSGADLRGAVLSSAYLSGAVLHGADLSGAVLTGAGLSWTIGNRKEIFNILHIPEYHITYTKDVLAVGCEQHTWKEWESFSDKEIDKMGEDALELWKKYKQHIFEMKQISFGEEEK
ncbi:MAG: pentapeptide repeat-containing protein, partial [Herbaspirillum sp.]